MNDRSLPEGLERLLQRGTLPHATLVVGGTESLCSQLVQRAQESLSVAPADTVVLSEPPAMAELRRTLGQLARTPHQSAWTFAVMYRFDAWGEELANVLLKTLEEPPTHVRIVLFAADDSAVLPTIRSRVARFRLGAEVDVSKANDFPSSVAQLSEQFAWSQQATAERGVQELAAPALASLTATQQRSALARLAQIGNHPVNKRLALDALLTRRKAE